MTDKKLIASVEQIKSGIFLIRGQKVMSDTDLKSQFVISNLWSQFVTINNAASTLNSPCSWNKW